MSPYNPRLEDAAWLRQQRELRRRTVRQIAVELGVSRSSLLVALRRWDIDGGPDPSFPTLLDAQLELEARLVRVDKDPWEPMTVQEFSEYVPELDITFEEITAAAERAVVHVRNTLPLDATQEWMVFAIYATGVLAAGLRRRPEDTGEEEERA